MKELYLKPDAQYISLEAEEPITDIFDGDMSLGELPEGWE